MNTADNKDNQNKPQLTDQTKNIPQPTAEKTEKLQFLLDLLEKPLEKQIYAADLMQKGAQAEDIEIQNRKKQREEDLKFFEENQDVIKEIYQGNPEYIKLIDKTIENIQNKREPFTDKEHERQVSMISSASKHAMGYAKRKVKMENTPAQNNNQNPYIHSKIMNERIESFKPEPKTQNYRDLDVDTILRNF